MTDVMVDIETLGLASNAVVLSFAAVKFKLYDEKPMIDKRHTWVLNLRSQFGKGRTTTYSTLEFWRDQPAAARAHWELGDPMSVELALQQFGDLFPREEEHLIWANGIIFDIGILESLHRDFNVDVPWRYNAPRDMRTIIRTLSDTRKRPPSAELGIAHHPEDDCVHQIWSLWEHWPKGDLDPTPKVTMPAPRPPCFSPAPLGAGDIEG
jgi:3' exoribonuclease, RNase T-like